MSEGPTVSPVEAPGTLSASSLRGFAIELLTRCGVPEADAAPVAYALLDADLRGISSHGLALLPAYLRRLREGTANPRPEIRTVRERAGAAVLDGGGGLGPLVAVRAMALAIDKARAHAVGAVGVRNANHFGAAGYYAALAAQSGMVGFATSNAAAIMAPPGGTTAVVSNNPVAIAFPARSEPYLLVDLTLSVVAYNKIRRAVQRGEKIPLGWALDKSGVPTEDPAAALQGLLLPIGGHKGFALALALDVLTAVLTDGYYPWDILARNHHGMGFFLFAINVADFVTLEEFRTGVEAFLERIRMSARLPGVTGIYAPGDRSAESRREHEANGIPLSSLPWSDLQRLADELGVRAPA